MNSDNNIVWHEPSVKIDDRWKTNGYKSCALWFTGLSASGKSTIAHALDKKLHAMGIHSYVLDGDNVRHGLNRDLGLSPADRKENIRRIGEVARLFVDAGLVVLAAFIAPYREDRRMARKLFEPGRFIEIYVKCSIEECERRDPKGFYKKARTNEIKEFTGISAPYEEPLEPELTIESDNMSVTDCINKVTAYLEQCGYIPSGTSG